MQFVAYYRVSTQKQGRSGLGLEAQRDAVGRHLKTTGGKLVASYQEIESGTNNDRPELKEAVALAKKRKATLIVAKLDRLGRKASYILRLIDESGVNFHICDMPDADKLTITILAAIAEREALNTSQRTKAALAVKKAQGVKLGNPRIEEARAKAIKVIKAGKQARAEKVIGIIEELQTKAHVGTLAGLAECLNLRGIPTPRNGKWTATSVRRVIAGAERAAA
jgi:DNA invertase Pin-like site-specific DNA recombinase